MISLEIIHEADYFALFETKAFAEKKNGNCDSVSRSTSSDVDRENNTNPMLTDDVIIRYPREKV